MEIHESPEIYERVIHYDPIKDHQVRLTINNFRGVEYLHLRKYYMDFDGTWKASNEGVAMPLDLANSKELFIGLVEILSLAESRSVIEEYFKDSFDRVYVE